MPLTEADRAEVRDYILGFLANDFFEHLTRYYAEGVAYSNRHPQNINNELRNAITHMARMLRATNRAEIDYNKRAADSHVQRFKRDCLKVAVVYAGKDAGNLLKNAYRRYKHVDPALFVRSSQIVRRRVEATMLEALGDEQTVQTWEELFRDIAALRERIFAIYPTLDQKNHRFPLWVYQWWDYFKNFCVAVFVGIVITILANIAIPNQEWFGCKIRAAISTALACPAPVANSPSTAAKLGEPLPPK